MDIAGGPGSVWQKAGAKADLKVAKPECALSNPHRDYGSPQIQCVSIAWSIQCSNMQYRFVALEQQAIPYRLGV